MERIALGKSGLEVSPVAFGTWQLSPRFWGDLPKDAVENALHRAVDIGINFIDTADAYGDGYGETVVGGAIRGISREKLVIATKVFNHFNPDGTRYPDLSGDHVIERCEASLKRLGIDCIDLYLLHFPDPMAPMAETADALDRLKKQGKIRAIGVSNNNVEQLRAQRRFGPYDVIQPPYSLVDPSIEKDLLPYCEAEGVGVMVYSPMHKGLLTGKYTGEETFKDFRKFHPDFQGERFRKLAQGVQSLRPIAERYGLSLYQLLLATTLMHPAIQVAICGIKTPGQVEEAAGAMGKKIDRKDIFSVRSAVSGVQASKLADASGTHK